MSPGCALASVVLGALLSTGCYTTTHVVSVSPLKTKYPVSASGQYLDAEGQIVTEDQYRVVSAFDFSRRIEAPRHETSDTPLQLETELDRIMAEQRGDALTDVRIVATDYDAGSHGSAAGWKILGWTFGLTGATFAVFGASADGAEALLPVGGVFMGLGVLSYAFSAAATDPAVWTVQVKGNVVHRRAPPVSSPPVSSPPVSSPPVSSPPVSSPPVSSGAGTPVPATP